MKTIRRFASTLLLAALAAPVLVFAQGGRLNNPLNPSISSVPAFVESALRAVVYIALPIIALFIVYAGFKYVLARGNESKITQAHENFLYVLIGALLILGAWVLATLIGSTVTQLVGN
jgi:hypothetical protein